MPLPTTLSSLFLRVTNFFSLCGCSRVQMSLFRRGGYYPRPTRAYQTAHTTWAYIRARRRAAGCMMAPIQVVHSRYSTTISEGDARKRVSDGLCKISNLAQKI